MTASAQLCAYAPSAACANAQEIILRADLQRSAGSPINFAASDCGPRRPIFKTIALALLDGPTTTSVCKYFNFRQVQTSTDQQAARRIV